MHIEVSKAPPSKIVSVALANMRKGRYVLAAEDLVEEFDSEAELRSYLEYCNMFSLLIERVIAEVKADGICVLKYKGIIIRDTEWRNPVASINWSHLKLPKLS